MTLPNFVVIGAAKSGSTTLCRQISRHPDIFMSTPKELDFFNRHYSDGIDKYENYFKDWSGEKAIGEGSVLYSIASLFPEVPERMARHIPKARLIYMVRHPLERIESMWCQHVADGEMIPEFNQAVREWRPLIDGSMYQRQISRFLEYYNKDQILILFLDEYKKDPVSSLKKCFKFIGVDTEVEIENPDERANNRSDMTMFHPTGAWLRNSKLGVILRSKLGKGIKDHIRPYTRKNLDISPCWEAATLKWVVETIQGDTKDFLYSCGKENSLWDMSNKWCEKRLEKSIKNLSNQTSLVKKKPFVLGGLDFFN